MQPTNNTPTPPAPKQGFWAKLFGKKPKETPTPPQGSLAPPPQLNDPADATDPTAAVGADPTMPGAEGVPPASPSTDPMTGLPTTNEEASPAGDEGEKFPPTLDVPPSVQGTPLEENEGVPPTLPTEPGVSSGEQQSAAPDLSSEEPPTGPEQQEPTAPEGEDPTKQL